MKWPFNWPKKYVIGRADQPYLTRWDFFNNRHSKKAVPHLFLHQFHTSDSAAGLHSHPWLYISLILKTGYWEQTAEGVKWIKPLSLIYRPSTWVHRIILEPGTEGKVWTLVFTGPKIQDWGFFCPKAYTHWSVVVQRESDGLPGCPE